MQDAARKLGLELQVVGASNASDIDVAFATLVQKRAQALVIDGDAVFANRRQQLAALMLRHAMPAIYGGREFPDAGGLMSYGTSVRDADRLCGVYVGRILKGDKPADLPVQQSVKVELIIKPDCRRRGDPVKRRTFIAGLGSAAAWPVAGRAQEAASPALPLIGFQRTVCARSAKVLAKRVLSKAGT